MTIRGKLIISYILIITIFSFGLLLIIEIITIRKMTDRHVRLAVGAVNGIAKVNYSLSKRVLVKFGEEIVKMEADSSAHELALLFNKNKKLLNNYKKIQQDQEIRAVAARPLTIHGKACGYIDLLDRKGVAVVHPIPEVQGKNYRTFKKKFPKMWDLVEKSFTEPEVSGYYNFLDETGRKRNKYMAIVHVPGTDFNVVAAVNIDDYFLPVHQNIREEENKHTERVTSQIKTISRELSHYVRIISAIFVLILILVCILFAICFSGSISKPITRLVAAVKEFGKGDFEVRVEEKGSQETTQLATEFNRLGERLREYIETLKKETAARQAVESEVTIARSIQQSLLPRKFPPFPDYKQFGLFAKLEPAKEVAGDFFDYFFIDDNRLAIIVGDVSGKGIPAAFFMAVVRTIFRNTCHSEPDPAEAMKKANDLLTEDNDTMMFVTVFLGYYDIPTGNFTYANGGHHEAIIVNSECKCERFGRLGNPSLGIVESADFNSGERKIQAGETMAIFTDGIIEAPSDTGEEFGFGRLEKILAENCNANSDLRRTWQAVDTQVDNFQTAPGKFDDVTLLLFKRNS